MRSMQVEALHLDADLPGVAERSRYDAVAGPFEGRVVMHQGGGVASELEQHALLAADGLEVPADGSAAGERERREAIVLTSFSATGTSHGTTWTASSGAPERRMHSPSRSDVSGV